jgi:hypothetical protein
MLPREGWQFAGDFVGCQELAKHNLSSGPLASSVKSPSSMALGSVFEPQKPRPSCRMPSGVEGAGGRGFFALPVVVTVAIAFASSFEFHDRRYTTQVRVGCLYRRPQGFDSISESGG